MSDKSPTTIATDIVKRNESLKQKRQSWDAFCQDVAQYVMPRKAQITRKDASPSASDGAQLFDNTAIQANQTLASGKLSWMTPHDNRWFEFDVPRGLAPTDEVKQWLRDCSRIAQQEIGDSNFYTEIHELYLDRGAFGTACMYIEEGRNSTLQFTTFPMGTYSLAEDAEKMCDTCYREFKLNPRQAAQRFGVDNLSEELQKALKSGNPADLDKEFDFIHAIYPRDPAAIDPRKMDPMNMPIASCYIEVKNKHLCAESGYFEKPFAATRYLKWGDNVYGWSPAWIALPDSKQVNFLEKNMDALAEIQAFPRVLIPESLEGDVDMRAGGATYYNGADKPTEWATEGRYDVGLDRADRKRKAINEAFHVDLFRMFAGIDKQMTAREVNERAGEKLSQFSPTFARMTVELFNPILQRVFSILLRAGKLPPPPEEARVVDNDGEFVPTPKVVYTSRIALAIAAHANIAFDRTLERWVPVLQIKPDILDNWNLDQIARDSSRNDGMPAEWLAKAEDVAKLRQARAEAAAKQAQMEQAAMAADAASKVGRIPANSPVAEKIGGMAA